MRSGSRGLFLLSLGLAAGLHGAALAYAIGWHRPDTVAPDAQEVVTVEIVDAALIEDQTAPEPPTDKLPSAAAESTATSEAPTDEAPDRTPAIDQAAMQEFQVASAAPLLGEHPRETVVEARAASALAEPAASVPTSAAKPVKADEPALAMLAPSAETATVAVRPPVAEDGMPEETRSAALAPSSARDKTRKTFGPLRIVMLAARPLGAEALTATEPEPDLKSKVKRKRLETLDDRADDASEKPAAKKAKSNPTKAEKSVKKQESIAKRLAALPVEDDGTSTDSIQTAKAKPAAQDRRKGTKGKGRSDAETSGEGGIGSYGGVVRARVARNKPRGMTGRGTVIVTIGVSPSGGLRFARLSRSSGNAALDRAAMAAVQRSAPFPDPPAGASPGQLVFHIPIAYR
jgi:protein TonB